MLFIEYPKCTTCKKAKKFLDDNNLKNENDNLFEEEDPFLDDNKVEINKEDLFNEKDPFLDDNNITNTSSEIKVEEKNQSSNEDIFSNIEPFDNIELYQDRVEDYEMPDMDMYLEEPVEKKGGK